VSLLPAIREFEVRFLVHLLYLPRDARIESPLIGKLLTLCLAAVAIFPDRESD
jgi:hypothetical protein